MIWLSPWAWLGLGVLAAPVVIHLLTRHRARTLPFPTLRFLPVTTTSAVKRRALKDLALLALRLAVLAAVVAAAARPYLVTRPRQLALDSTLRRAVVIDTGAGMQRITARGVPGIEIARERATALTPAPTSTRTVEMASLPAAIERAATWLDTGAGRRELVVISDFRRGAVDAGDFTRLRAAIGVRLMRIDSSPSGSTPRAGGTLAPVRMLSGPAATADVLAALSAARQLGLPLATGEHRAEIVLPDATERARLFGDAAPLNRTWMFDVLERIRRDARLSSLSTSIAVDDTLTATPSLTPLLRRVDGAVLAVVARGAGGDALTIFTATHDPLVVSLLLSSAAQAIAVIESTPPVEPDVIPDAELTRWERPALPDDRRPMAPDDASDGRWFWMAALILLGIETVVRRSGSTPAMEDARERVA